MGYWARVTLTVAGILLVLGAAWKVCHILLLVLVAAVLAVGLDPQVRWLQKRHLSRTWAGVTVVLLGVGLFVLFGWLIIPPAIHQAHEFAKHIPAYINRVQRSRGVLGTIERNYHLAERLRDATARFPSLALGKIPGITAGVGSIIFNLLTVAVLTVYFLMGLPHTTSLRGNGSQVRTKSEPSAS
jgi:predicted PurR-regulated permease PerM